jgi:hypothetical protein
VVIRTPALDFIGVYFIFATVFVQVSVEVDYIQPPSQGFPEKTCCTVTIGGM